MTSINGFVVSTNGSNQSEIDRLNLSITTLNTDNDIQSFINSTKGILVDNNIYFDFRSMYIYDNNNIKSTVDYTGAVSLTNGSSLWIDNAIIDTKEYENNSVNPRSVLGVIVVKTDDLTYMDSGGYKVGGFDSLVSVSLERAILHEISHLYYSKNNINAWLTRDINNQDVISGDRLSYQEGMAIATENFLYVPYAIRSSLGDASYRLNHTNTAPFRGGVSGMDAFSSISGPRSIDVSQTGKIVFNSTDASDGTSLSMSFYDVDHSVKVSEALAIVYDHYIKYDLSRSPSSLGTSALIKISSAGLEYATPIVDVLTSSIVADVTPNSYGLDPVLDTSRRLSALSYLQHQEGVPTISAVTDILSGIKSMISLSAARFTYDTTPKTVDEDRPGGFMDITGPVSKIWSAPDSDGNTHASMNRPRTIAIDESGRTTGAIIFGASGYDDRYVSPSVRTAASIDLSTSVDHILGSSQGDVIVVGTGYVTGMKNDAYGMDGNDILIGRSGEDRLFGGKGNDILIGGFGNNNLSGGDNFDIVSYAGRTDDMMIDLRSGIVYSPYSRDSLSSIEGVIAGNGHNTFYGDGHTLMIGGTGNDTFYLQPGDMVIGGGGSDTYILGDPYSHPTSVHRFAILDLDSNDFMRGATTYMQYYNTPNSGSSIRNESYTTFGDVSNDGSGRISVKLNTFSSQNFTGTPDIHKTSYEIYTASTPPSGYLSLDGFVNGPMGGPLGGTWNLNKLFDLRIATTGTNQSERLSMDHQNGLYDSGGGNDIAAYDDMTHAPIKVTVSSAGVDTSYTVDSFSGSYQHEFRHFSGIVATAGSDVFDVTSFSGTGISLTGGAGSDLLSLRQSSGKATIDLDTSSISLGGGNMSFSGIEKIELGNDGSFVHATQTLDTALYLYTGAGSHQIDVVNGVHVRAYDFSSNVTLNVQQDYDRQFSVQDATYPSHSSTIFVSTEASSGGGLGRNMNLVFNETYSGEIVISNEGGFGVIGSTLFNNIGSLKFDADNIQIDMSDLPQSLFVPTLYGSLVSSTIHGTSQSDNIYGRGSSGDEIHGGGGTDYIYGSDHGSILFGDDGNDEIRAGTGNDQIHGGSGFDRLFGGKGDDTFFVSGEGGQIMGGLGYPSADDWGIDTVQFEFGLESVTSISVNQITESGHSFLAATVVAEGRSFTLYDCDFMNFAGMNSMAITPGLEYFM